MIKKYSGTCSYCADCQSARAVKAEAELAEVKRERDDLLIKVASPDCMGCAHRDRAGEIIRKLEAEVEELSEENQQLVADNIGYRDQIDLLTKDAIDREALELEHLGVINTLKENRDHWQRGNFTRT